MLAVFGDLHLDAPGGGTLRVSADDASTLTLTFSDGATLRELLRAAQKAVPSRTRFLRLLRERNPLTQNVRLRVADREAIRWPAGRRLRLSSLRGLLGLIS